MHGSVSEQTVLSIKTAGRRVAYPDNLTIPSLSCCMTSMMSVSFTRTEAAAGTRYPNWVPCRATVAPVAADPTSTMHASSSLRFEILARRDGHGKLAYQPEHVASNGAATFESCVTINNEYALEFYLFHSP